LFERCDQVDDLDAGFKQLRRDLLLLERRRRTMDRVRRCGGHRPLQVDGLAEHVKDSPEGLRSHWHANRPTRVGGYITALKSVGSGHCHGTHPVVAEVLLHLNDEMRAILAWDVNCIVDFGELVGRELYVHDWPDDLHDGSIGSLRHGSSWGISAPVITTKCLSDLGLSLQRRVPLLRRKFR